MTPGAIRTAFTGSPGHELAARLDLPPSGPVRDYALLAHCFTCSKDSLAARHIAGKLASLGIGVPRLDFTGLGSSEGEFANTSFSPNVEDLVRRRRGRRLGVALPARAPGGALDDGVVVAETGRQIPEQRTAGRHRLLADEPTAVGGISPYDCLAIAQGTCTSVE